MEKILNSRKKSNVIQNDFIESEIVSNDDTFQQKKKETKRCSICKKCQKCKEDKVCKNCILCKNCEYWSKIAMNDDFEVSTHGKIREFGKTRSKSTNLIRGGYKSFVIPVNGKDKFLKVHQVVAKTFIPNPENKYAVNHKDGNKMNNHISNLEWTTIKENNQHAVDNGLIKKTKRRVSQYSLDKKTLIKIHDTLRGAGTTTGIDSGGISKVCKGARNSAGGYWWKFTDKNENECEINKKEFSDVKNCSNYMINKKGDVYSKRYKKIMKYTPNNDGYLTIQLTTNDKKRKTLLGHQLVAINFIKNTDDSKTKVKFKDGNKKNLNVKNLYWSK